MRARRVTVVASEVLGVPGTGGPGTADSLLATALARHGHHVRLLVAPGRATGPLTPAWQRIYSDAGVQVSPLERRGRVRPPFLEPTLEVLAALRRDPPDVVVADDWRGLAYAALRLRQVGLGFPETAFVVYCHGPARVLAEAARKVPDTLARCGEEVAERACLELADAVVSPSEWLLGWMRGHGWPVPESALVVQNLWQSTALGQPPARAPEPTRVRRLVFFGQLREGKGVALFVEAVRRLEAELLAGRELVFLGRETPRWTEARIRDELGREVADRCRLRFETSLERSQAIQELLQPGTLVTLPTLLENSPYAVAECIEHGIPFVAARTGGIPELVDDADHDRVLFTPTVEDVAASLTQALSSDAGFEPARPRRPPDESLEAWLELLEHASPPRARGSPSGAQRVAVVARGEHALAGARKLAGETRSVEVEVVPAGTRRQGVERATAEWVVFLDDEDVPEQGLLEALATAQAATGADAVTAAVRPADDPDTIHAFLGDPGALGLVGNHYGVLALVRRSATAHVTVDDGVDPDWPLLERIVLGGGRVVSIPAPYSLHRGRPGTVADVPGPGLAVLEAFEERQSDGFRDLPQLAAAATAALMRLESQLQAAGGAGRRTWRGRALRALGRVTRLRRGRDSQ